MAGLPAFSLDGDEGERLVFGDVTILVRASAESTGGAFNFLQHGITWLG
jgi:hypothetical protein